MESEKIETTELKDIAIEYNVDIVKAEETTLGLKPTIDARTLLIEEFETVSKLEINLENLPTFKELRLKFVKNRTQGIDKWHKAAKEVPLRMSQLIDAVKRNETQINETHESFLEKAEKHFEIQEQKRLEALQIERAKEISKYLDPEHIDNDLSNMNDMVWDAYLQGTKLNYDNKIAAEKKAEEERIEKERITKLNQERKELILPYHEFLFETDLTVLGLMSIDEFTELIESLKAKKVEYDKKQETIRKENLRLEKEAEAKEKARLAELEKIRIEREKEAAKSAIAQAKLNAENQAKEKQLQALKEVEQKEKQRLLDIEMAREKAEKAAALAPDKDKLLDLSKRIMSIDMPVLKAKEANDIMLNVTDLLSKIDSYITEKVESL